MIKTKHFSNILLASLLVALGQAGFSQTKLLDVLQDENARGADFGSTTTSTPHVPRPSAPTSRCLSRFDASPATPARGSTPTTPSHPLEKTMRRVLVLHEDYPNNKNGLAGKLGKLKPYKTALEMPGMKHRAKLSRSTARNNCVHCHNIHDAEHEQLYREQKLSHDTLWR